MEKEQEERNEMTRFLLGFEDNKNNQFMWKGTK